MKTLNTIFSIEKEIELGEKKIKIKTLTLGDIPLVADFGYKIATEWSKSKKDTKVVILSLIKNDFNSVVKLIEATTDLGTEDIRKLNLAATAKITSEVLKENGSFLEEFVAPAIQEATNQIATAVKMTAGSSQSKD